jgi:hypothetical protein
MLPKESKYNRCTWMEVRLEKMINLETGAGDGEDLLLIKRWMTPLCPVLFDLSTKHAI